MTHVVEHSVILPVFMNHHNYICTLSVVQVGRGTSGDKSLTSCVEYTDWVTWEPSFLVPLASLLRQQ